jgi:hypothetical protein
VVISVRARGSWVPWSVRRLLLGTKVLLAGMIALMLAAVALVVRRRIARGSS